MKDFQTIIHDLKNKRVYFDTNAIIYFIEQNKEYFELVFPMFQMIGTSDIVAFTSEFTLIETLIKPIREKENQIIQDIKDLLLDPDLFTLTPTPRNLFIQGAEIGGNIGLRPADSIHFASAIEHHCHYFITNDKKFKSSHGVEVLVLRDYVL